MKLLPYKEIISKSKELIDEALAPIRARQVKAKAELKTAEIDAELVKLEGQVQELCVDKDIDFDAVIKKLDEAALLERRKTQYAEVVAQLFPSETETKVA